MTNKKDENKINLGEMVAKSSTTSKKSSDTNKIMGFIADQEKPHGFSKSININKGKEIEDLDDLLHSSKHEHHVRIPFSGMNYISLSYTKNELSKMIKENIFLNPKVEVPSQSLSLFDSLLVSSKYVSEETKDIVIDKCIEDKIPLDINGEIIETAENKEEKMEYLIKDIHMSKDGQVYVLLNNKVMIKKFVNVTSIGGSLMTFQKSLNKAILPKELIALTGTLFTDQENDNILIGRIGKDLALKVDLNSIFKQVILPQIIVEKDSTVKPSIEKAELFKSKYSPFIKTNVGFDPREDVIGFSLETSRDLPLDIYVDKKNFICLNSSILNENLKGILKTKVLDYICQEVMPKHSDITSEDIIKMDLDIKLVPIASLSKHYSSKGVPLSDLITINSYTSPLYLPVIEVNKDCFIKDSNNPIYKSWIFKEAGFKKPDIEKICKVFGRFIPNNDPFLSETCFGYDERLSIIPDIKRLMMSIFIDMTDKFEGYAISVSNKESITSCAFQVN